MAAIVFDLDGTLIDSAVVVLAVLNQIRKERGAAPLLDAEVRPHLSKGGLRLVAESLGVVAHDPDKDLALFRAYYASQKVRCAFPGVHQMISALSTRGHRLGICTNKPRLLCDQALHHNGLASFFQSVVTAGETIPAKPDPAALLQSCRELGSDPCETLMVGDSEVDRDVARNAGAKFVLVTYGYPVGNVQDIEAAAKCSSARSLGRSLVRLVGNRP